MHRSDILGSEVNTTSFRSDVSSKAKLVTTLHSSDTFGNKADATSLRSELLPIQTSTFPLRSDLSLRFKPQHSHFALINLRTN